MERRNLTGAAPNPAAVITAPPGQGVRRGGRGRSRVAFRSLAVASFLVAGATGAQGAEREAGRLAFEHFSIEQGLPDPTVTAVLQDRRGFLWVGTEKGLNRYDGYEFRTVGAVGEVLVLFQDRAGTLWVGTDDGLHFYDRRTERLIGDTEGAAGGAGGTGDADEDGEDLDEDDPIDEDGGADDGPEPGERGGVGGPDDNPVQALLEDRRGRFWVGAEGGVFLFDPRSRRYLPPPAGDARQLSDALRGQSVRVLTETRDGEIWAGTDEGAWCLRPGAGSVERFRAEPGRAGSIGHDEVNCIYEDGAGTLWLGADGGGLHRFDAGTRRFARLPASPSDPGAGPGHDQVNAVFEDKGGLLWVGTLNGLNRFDRAAGRFQVDRASPADPLSLTYNEITAILEDASGLLWVGTGGGGLSKYYPLTASFAHFVHRPGDPNSIAHNRVWSICEDRAGRLWVGTEIGGLNQVDRTTGRVRHNRHDPADPTSISGDEVTAILEDSAGRLWLGIDEGGLLRMDPAAGTFKRVGEGPGAPPGRRLSDETVSTVVEGTGGQIWIGTDGGGLNRFDPASGAFDHFVHREGDPTSLSDDEVWAVLVARDGGVWAGTSDGLNHLDPATGRCTRFQPRRGDPGSLSDRTVWSLLQTGDGVIWAGTARGLNRFEGGGPRGLRFTPLGTADGLPHPTVYAMVEDATGDLWLSTGNGISRFRPSTGRFRNFGADVLHNLTFNRGAAFRSDTGEVFFGGMRGFNAFFPAAIPAPAGPPRVAITGLRILNRPVGIGEEIDGRQLLEAAISETGHIRLSHRDSVVSFAFAALDFTAPSQNRYAYRLEGFDREWNDIDTRRVATYTNLPAGRFQLRVKAANADGVWSAREAVLGVEVAPPPWRTWWAYALYTALALGAVLGFVRLRTVAHRRELRHKETELAQERRLVEQERRVSEQLRVVDQLKDDFLANVSHELRTPLHGIIGIVESLQAGIAGPPTGPMLAEFSMISASGRRLASLVNDLLDFSKLKRRDLQLSRGPVDLRSLAQVVLKLSEPLVGGRDLELCNEVPADLPPAHADENRIQQIFHNLVGNAIKFTDGGRVTISARRRAASGSGGNGRGEGDGQGGAKRAVAEELAVTVSDTGIGIAADKLEAIFASFEQADASISREYGGTGLGLSITRQLVELHGGTITVASDPGRGSAFTFTLPVSAGGGAAEPADFPAAHARGTPLPAAAQGRITLPPLRLPETPDLSGAAPGNAAHAASPLGGTTGNGGAPAAPGGRGSILVVDDEPINQHVLASHLTAEGYAVTAAYSGEEVFRLLDEGASFDLVLLDIMMPRVSGYEVCQRIREHKLSNELPVIMVTAKNQVTDLLEGFSSGANDYLAKPFSKDELLARVHTHLNLLRINSAYGRFVPREFLRHLHRDSIIDVRLGDFVNQEITILFSDIRDFTSLTERMGPAGTFRFLNEFLNRMGPVIRDHGGFIDKFIGDSIMALFPGSPDDALAAAVTLRSRLAEYNREREDRGDPPIGVGYGIHTGDVMLGTIGEEERMDGTVIADAVNLASRLEGLTKRYGAGILVSEDTLAKAARPGAYHRRFIGKIRVKGKAKAVAVFEVYDGDAGSEITGKNAAAADFEQGLRHYFAREFTQAAIALERAIAANPGDKTAQLYLQRSAENMVKGVPEDWQGIEVAEEK